MARSPFALVSHFTRLKDPRIRGRRRHLLLDLIGIAICAVVAGADTWAEIAAFGRRHHDWLRRFLRLPNGSPSHDTFQRLFDRLDPSAFGQAFLNWTRALSAALGTEHVAVDGKVLRHSGGVAGGPLHIVSAWAVKNQLTLGQLAVDQKSNEITALPRLLELLDLAGALVTIDAMGCQKNIAKQIVAQGGDYVLVVKDNHPNLLDDIRACMEKVIDSNFRALNCERYSTEDRGHGRTERRYYTIFRDLSGIRDREAWTGLSVAGMCYSERTVNGQTSSEVRYFIGSRKANVEVYGAALRNHWHVENCLHWQMDVSFGEDRNRTSNRHAAENFAALRRLALGLLKRHPGRGSIVCKRKEAGWDVKLLEEILKG
jgi:predicted transposase YbfD/YdcC